VVVDDFTADPMDLMESPDRRAGNLHNTSVPNLCSAVHCTGRNSLRTDLMQYPYHASNLRRELRKRE